ncbi:MAG: PIN domain-containing protein [Gemmatimonadota bacterium]|nr:MAG: PIN domain-containing protein [Gemmatimonadota bacterium]
MNVAYVDTSALVAIAFGERGGSRLARRLERFDELLSSNLLEAELLSAFAREGVDGGSNLLTWFTWILPSRALSQEIASVLSAGYLRGADLWHLACALYVAESAQELSFVSLDERQREVAEMLGFRVL